MGILSAKAVEELKPSWERRAYLVVTVTRVLC